MIDELMLKIDKCEKKNVENQLLIKLLKFAMIVVETILTKLNVNVKIVAIYLQIRFRWIWNECQNDDD